MRRIAVLLAALLLALLPATAYAGMHWGAPDPTRGTALQGLALVIIMIIILAWLIMRFLGASTPCAFFVAVGSVATKMLLLEYILIFVFGTPFASKGIQLPLLAVFDVVVLVAVLIWAAPCCLGKRVSLMDALKITLVPALLPVLFVGFR